MIFDMIVTMLLNVAVVALMALTDGMSEVLKFGDDFLSTYNKLLFSTDDSGLDGLYVVSGSSFFGDVGDIIGIMQGIGISLLGIIYLIHLIKSMFYNLNSQATIEHPMEILKRALLYGAILVVYPLLVTVVFKQVFSPLNEPVNELELQMGESWEDIVSASIATSPIDTTEEFVNAIGSAFTQFVGAVIKLVGMIVIVFHFFRLMLEVVERFLQVFFLTLFGPICIACGASPVLFVVSYSWFMTWLNSGIMCIVNVFMTKLSLIAIYNFLLTFPESVLGGSFGELLIKFFLTYGTIRLGYTMDNYLGQLDVPILRAGGFENPLMRSKLLEAAIKS